MAKGNLIVSKDIGYNIQEGLTKKITYRSSWELDLMKKLQILYKAKRIKSWSSEETIFEYTSPIDGKSHRYFLDFTLELYDERVVFIEVKPKHETKPPKKTKNQKSYQYAVKTWITNNAKWNAVQDYCKKENSKLGWQKYTFQIWTEDVIYPNGKY